MGRVTRIDALTVGVAGLTAPTHVGDGVEIRGRTGTAVGGEIVSLGEGQITALVDGRTAGLTVGDPVILTGARTISPHSDWLGRIINADGKPMNGAAILNGEHDAPLHADPPPVAERRGLGPRIATGLALFDTILPLVRGQRIGLFAGSGVGKSSLLAQLAQGLDADVVIIALIGERGREINEFVSRALGPRGMARSVVFAATSDRPAQERRRCLWAAMATAEHFRDQGNHVLLLCDSLTRYAEAHREIALARGERGSMRGFPPSTVGQITALCERAGPGTDQTGDITAVFTVLVAGSDMEEPVADIVRGVLDGHIVLEREIAERGRFPSVDILRSVSRSLPEAADDRENALIQRARKTLGTYENAEMMIQSGLYVTGSNAEIDDAVRVWPRLDRFASLASHDGIAASFTALKNCFETDANPGEAAPDFKSDPNKG
jgi:flagellum-specific ATP synthase